jgi:hypothetical protein
LGSNKNNKLPKALRLFLSVDIAGSTAFKSLEPSKVQPWLPTLYWFFAEFQVELASRYANDKRGIQPPVLWKTLGDEMVFVALIEDHLQVSTHICHFRDTIAAYREVIKDASKKLDLKGAAWLAGFPVGNTVVKLHRDTEGNASSDDYLGPSIDTGFRLSKHATPRKFVLSVETAFMLLASASPDGVDIPKVYLEQGDELKGVLGGRPYPRLWIGVPYDSADDFRKLEEDLLEAPPARDDKKLRDYCKLFIREYGTPLFMPFIDKDKIFGEPPPGYEEQYDEVCALWAKNKIGQYLRHQPPIRSRNDRVKEREKAELEKQIAQIGLPPQKGSQKDSPKTSGKQR